MSRVLVTGGAGFIGRHLAKALLREGHTVRVLDRLVEQVHGSNRIDSLGDDVELVVGDIRDAELVRRSLQDIDVVFHEAAEVGVGQSMYEVSRYVEANTYGTSVLLDALLERRDEIRKLIVASSMSLYGEGEYRCPNCGPVNVGSRPVEQLLERRWEPACPNCGSQVDPIPTTEQKEAEPTSVYAITKQDQEQLCLVVGRAYDLPTVALRYFNVYGPGQALSNPYTGVCAIFSARLLNGNPPMIFEDGGQTRDFVHVSDIVQANLLALASDGCDYQAVNVGTGKRTSIEEVAHLLANGLGLEIDPEFVNRFREGDIRHCVADISRARERLGYEPSVDLADGIPELLEWVKSETARDEVDTATAELEARRLVR
jgi:dTDP-L-rhamnose 4-epimerase